jgi:hypothetical protein
LNPIKYYNPIIAPRSKTYIHPGKIYSHDGGFETLLNKSDSVLFKKSFAIMLR